MYDLRSNATLTPGVDMPVISCQGYGRAQRDDRVTNGATMRNSEPTLRMLRLATQLTLLALMLAAVEPAGARWPPQPNNNPSDTSLREAVHTVAVPAAGADIVVTSYRPAGNGPHPWIIFSHGTATTPEANRDIGRYRNLPLMRQWVQRGYAVLVPVRRGYGASGGKEFGDSYGNCKRPDFAAAGEGAALDLLVDAPVYRHAMGSVVLFEA
jgi:hypothetical protein